MAATTVARRQPGDTTVSPRAPSPEDRDATPALPGAGAPDAGAGPFGPLAVAAAFLLPVAFSPEVYHAFWAPKAAVCLLLIGPGLVALAHLVRRRDRAAMLAALFLGSAAVSTILSGSGAVGLTGAPNLGTGLGFVAAVVGAWALGVTSGEQRRRQIAMAFVAAAVVNAVVALLQARDLVPIVLESPGRSFGLMGNPVYLGALVAAAAWVVARRVGREGRSFVWLGPLVLLAGAAQLSGGRSAVGLTVLAAVAALRGAGWRRGAALLAAVAVGFLVAPMWAGGGAVTGVGRSVGAEAGSQFGTRLGFWKIGAEAVAERPVLGWGPGRFEAATSPRSTVAVSEGGVNVFKDAHNWVVEYGVTTGLVGLALLVGWLVVAGRAASGPLAGVAALVGLFMLVEPQSVGLTPLALLALGASRREQAGPLSQGRGWLVGAALGLAAGVVAAGVFLGGEAFLHQGALNSSPDSIERGAALLPAWADVSRLGARTASFAGLHSDEYRARALSLARQATRREPSDPAAWSYLARLELLWGTDPGAAQAVDRTLERNPWYGEALVSSAALGERTGDEARRADACDRLRTLGQPPRVCRGAAAAKR